jgi:hypothetical protein
MRVGQLFDGFGFKENCGIREIRVPSSLKAKRPGSFLSPAAVN